LHNVETASTKSKKREERVRKGKEKGPEYKENEGGKKKQLKRAGRAEVLRRGGGEEN